MFGWRSWGRSHYRNWRLKYFDNRQDQSFTHIGIGQWNVTACSEPTIIFSIVNTSLIYNVTLNIIRLLEAGLPSSIRLLFIDKPKAHNHQGCSLYNSQANQPGKVERNICFKSFNSILCQQTENSIKTVRTKLEYSSLGAFAFWNRFLIKLKFHLNNHAINSISNRRTSPKAHW